MILGVGELVVDIVLDDFNLERARVSGVSGGGTVWNVLANAAHMGAPIDALAVGGDDWRAELADQQLAAAGVKRSAERSPRKVTQAIYQLPEHRTSLLEPGGARMTPQCPICRRKMPPTRYARLDATDVSALSSATTVVFDRLGKQRRSLAQVAQRAGAVTVLDIGHRGFVRFTTEAQLRGVTEAFDLIQAPLPVYRSIAGRLGVSPPDLPRLGSSPVWVVTDGSEGVTVLDARSRTPIRVDVAAPDVSLVVDTVGAGDALLGAVLAGLASRRLSARSASAYQIASAIDDARGYVGLALGHVGARGHLTPSVRLADNPLFGRSVSDLRDQNHVLAECIACGATDSTVRRRPRLSAKSNLSHLGRRLEASLRADEALDQARDWLSDGRSTVVCGTGGSYPVAVLVSDLMNSMHGFATPMHPARYLSIPPAADRVLAISYSGTNLDLGAVIRAALGAGVSRVGVVTIHQDPPIAQSRLLHQQAEVISYGRPGLESEVGFVSIAGTVMPAALWVAAAYGVESARAATEVPDQYAKQLEEIALRMLAPIADHLPVEVMATGWAQCAAADFESKMTESGVAVVRLHESKDFSHGRFIAGVGRSHPTLLLGVGKPTRYHRALARALEASTGGFSELRFPRPGGLGALDALVAGQRLAELTARFTGVDMSRPRRIPEEGVELYRWSGGLP